MHPAKGDRNLAAVFPWRGALRDNSVETLSKLRTRNQQRGQGGLANVAHRHTPATILVSWQSATLRRLGDPSETTWWGSARAPASPGRG